MTPDRQAQINTAYNNWQTALSAANGNALNAQNIQSILDADPQKYSTTPLTWQGVVFLRQDLQTELTKTQNNANSFASQASSLQTVYNDLVARLTAEQQSEDNQSNVEAEQNFQASNPSIIADLKKAETAIAAKAASVQGTTKYLIYGAIAIVLVIGGLYFFRSKFKA